MRFKIILNPYANRWGAQEKINALKEACSAANLDYELVIMERPLQATAAAYNAVTSEGFDAVVAAGGDGTVNEVVNGLLQASKGAITKPLGILPIGTGNDFSDMAELPRDIKEAVKIWTAGKTRQVDAGQVNDRYFDNNSALAMEPVVVIENIKMTKLSGNIRYIASLFKALVQLKAWEMKIEWDDGGYEGPVYLLSVCNTKRNGGQFHMAPNAVMDDGLFDFIFAPKISKVEVLKILGGLFDGSHINNPNITYGRTKQLKISSSPPTPIHTDGELITEGVTEIVYQILPGKLTIFTR